MRLSIGAQFFNQRNGIAEIRKADGVGDGMVSRANVAAPLFHLRNQTAQLLLQRGDIIPQNGVDAARGIPGRCQIAVSGQQGPYRL